MKAALLIVLTMGALAIGLRSSPDSRPTELARFDTSLAGRTPGQRHNAAWAAKRLNGAVIQPRATVSFNERVGHWISSEGAARAPVSFGGTLAVSWGGGVCQTSTTLYNAALLSGLTIVERHPHDVAPLYVPAGLDAAVAQGIADLKLKNPWPVPVRIHATAEGKRLTVRIEALGRVEKPGIRTVVEAVSIQAAPDAPGLKRQVGRDGARVRVWRIVGDQWEDCGESEYAPIPHAD